MPPTKHAQVIHTHTHMAGGQGKLAQLTVARLHSLEHVLTKVSKALNCTSCIGFAKFNNDSASVAT
jgi:hypothetical protein